MHSTNYYDAFIEVAEDCSAKEGIEPPVRKSGKTVANLEYELISKSPYKFTSDEVKFQVHAVRNDVPKADYAKEKQRYFSKGQACFRASPLTKTYGWGVHSNTDGKVAIYGMGTKEYEKLRKDKSINTVKAMRSKRK